MNLDDPDLTPTPRERAAIKIGTLLELRPFVAHLDRDGLELLRRRLRERDLAQTTGQTALLRAELLDAVSRALAALGVAPIEYYAGARDVLPAAPEDTTELDAWADGLTPPESPEDLL